ncbi:hypothetical protein AURDEDRAFT_131041 [Auricularia subglabra TFB-10046 SS5]|uniref:Uncharacterized protein n=1 Tax=Auricularia subglabra (strain TFB-10046 / SS5) TaxID=717982 RepID=J0D6X3_AURST|nr:hypothetical protein AURDEDRAFT_131041 [Auricularia subglabra TFB-10046 SS5]
MDVTAQLSGLKARVGESLFNEGFDDVKRRLSDLHRHFTSDRPAEDDSRNEAILKKIDKLYYILVSRSVRRVTRRFSAEDRDVLEDNAPLHLDAIEEQAGSNFLNEGFEDVMARHPELRRYATRDRPAENDAHDERALRLIEKGAIQLISQAARRAARSFCDEESDADDDDRALATSPSPSRKRPGSLRGASMQLEGPGDPIKRSGSRHPRDKSSEAPEGGSQGQEGTKRLGPFESQPGQKRRLEDAFSDPEEVDELDPQRARV